MPKIIFDERETNSINVCEQCGKTARGRYVEAVNVIPGSKSRGKYFLCFDCFAPRIHWRKSANGPIYKTPVEFKEE